MNWKKDKHTLYCHYKIASTQTVLGQKTLVLFNQKYRRGVNTTALMQLLFQRQVKTNRRHYWFALTIMKQSTVELLSAATFATKRLLPLKVKKSGSSRGFEIDKSNQRSNQEARKSTTWQTKAKVMKEMKVTLKILTPYLRRWTVQKQNNFENMKLTTARTQCTHTSAQRLA